jgi:hypothetical protein
VDVVFGAPEVVAFVPDGRLDVPGPPDEHAASRHIDAQSVSNERRRSTIKVYPISLSTRATGPDRRRGLSCRSSS